MQFKTQLIILIFFFFQIQSIDLHAKYVDGTLYLLDGKEINCIIDLPIRTVSKKITIKDDQNSKSRSISSDDIDMIKLESNGNSVTIRRTQVKTIKMNGDRKTSKNKLWVEVQYDCENIVSYTGVIGYDVTKKGDLIGITELGMAEHYLQRKGELHPTTVGIFIITGQVMNVGFNKQRKFKLVKYFSNDKEALSTFQSKNIVTASEIFEYIEQNCEE